VISDSDHNAPLKAAAPLMEARMGGIRLLSQPIPLVLGRQAAADLHLRPGSPWSPTPPWPQQKSRSTI